MANGGRIINKTIGDKPQFAQIDSRVLCDYRLSVGARLLYAGLQWLSWRGEGEYQGQEAIAAELGVSRRSVVTYMGELETLGYISVVQVGQGQPALVTIEQLRE